VAGIAPCNEPRQRFGSGDGQEGHLDLGFVVPLPVRQASETLGERRRLSRGRHRRQQRSERRRSVLRRAEIGTERPTSKWLSILRGPNRQAEDYVRTHGRRVEEVMTTEVVSVTEDVSLETIVSMMEKKHVKRVPIVNGRRLVGIVSRADLVRVLAKALAELPRANASDAALREQIDAELQRYPWAGRSNVSVIVTDGIVDLEGCIYNLGDRDALRVLAENVPGVKEVHDHLDYIDPSAVMIYGM